jgi:hypothetical protein
VTKGVRLGLADDELDELEDVALPSAAGFEDERPQGVEGAELLLDVLEAGK